MVGGIRLLSPNGKTCSHGEGVQTVSLAMETLLTGNISLAAHYVLLPINTVSSVMTILLNFPGAVTKRIHIKQNQKFINSTVT